MPGVSPRSLRYHYQTSAVCFDWTETHSAVSRLQALPQIADCHAELHALLGPESHCRSLLEVLAALVLHQEYCTILVRRLGLAVVQLDASARHVEDLRWDCASLVVAVASSRRSQVKQ